jgi:hypothetical protein
MFATQKRTVQYRTARRCTLILIGADNEGAGYWVLTVSPTFPVLTVIPLIRYLHVLFPYSDLETAPLLKKAPTRRLPKAHLRPRRAA